MNFISKAVLIIGCGQLGMRHLQSLALITEPIDITIHDLSSESMKKASELLKKSNGGHHYINIIKNIEHLKSVHFNLVIVATGANVRAEIVHRLIQSNVTASAWILEKVLVQSKLQLDQLSTDLIGQAVWVNCPRREYEFYKDLKRKIKLDQPVIMSITGSGWGLACNSIHYIDLLAYLTESKPVEISSDLQQIVHPSKRPGFIEFFGKLLVKFNNQSSLSLECIDGPTQAAMITISQGSSQWVINEGKGECIESVGDNQFVTSFKIPFQSELTAKVAVSIFNTGDCQLTPLNDSVSMHCLFIEELRMVYAKIQKAEAPTVPIT